MSWKGFSDSGGPLSVGMRRVDYELELGSVKARVGSKSACESSSGTLPLQNMPQRLNPENLLVLDARCR
jgi:hypothetical protein